MASAQSGWIQSNIGSVKLRSINFIDDRTGFIFGRMTKFYKTTDAGETWQDYDTPWFATSGSFIDENVGIIVGYYPHVTTDGGKTWVYGGGINPIPGAGFSTIFLKNGFMLNKDTGFVCGNEFGEVGFPPSFYVVAKIYRTTNSGQEWQLMNQGGVDWYDIKSDRNNKLYCIWSALITSFDFGQTWDYAGPISFTTAPHFLSEIFNDTMYASAIRGRIYKSFNGGSNWSEYQTASGDTLNKIFFLNSKTGWVAGDSGYILRTTNAGTNWLKQETSTTANINGIYFINKDTGFAVGDNGLLLKTYTGGTVGVQNVSSTMPLTHQLYQNYPNPFNPATVIQFDVVRRGHVRLTVYNLSGKEIEVLLHETLNAGTYAYEFKSEVLTSGVYFYRLEAEGFAQTKRMILIK
jgi:hypothetical protein